jgi:single-strand DNA-binding protein
MARTRKDTTIVEETGDVVELQPGIEDQEPVDQPDEAAQADAPDAETEDEQLEPQSRSREFSLNEVRLIGRIASDVTRYPARSGISVARFRMATNGPRDGDTEFHSLTAFGKTADFAAKYIAKGRKVYIEGRMQTRAWDDPRDHIRRWTTTILVNRLQTLDSRRTTATTDQAAQ